MKYSTVIATHNRLHCIEGAINSALAELPEGEIVVVDDASTDCTSEHLERRYGPDIATGRLSLARSAENLGVTGAKNLGYQRAHGDWVIFLDSDDRYAPKAGMLMSAEMDRSAQIPLIFFRCIDESGEFVGDLQNVRRSLDLETYVRHTSFGEALTAVNKALVGAEAPYTTELRGYEGLGCARLIRDHGTALLSDVVARIYITQGDDRLSSLRGMLNRMPLLAKGHHLMVTEFGPQMKVMQAISLVLKSVLYQLLGRTYKILSKG